MLVALVVLAVSTVKAASCDNACSGHGTCGQNGVCQCFDNWGVGMSHDSGDCSERICPFEFAWVDTPDKLGNHHKYAECANRGICDRETGECECFPDMKARAAPVPRALMIAVAMGAARKFRICLSRLLLISTRLEISYPRKRTLSRILIINGMPKRPVAVYVTPNTVTSTARSGCVCTEMTSWIKGTI